MLTEQKVEEDEPAVSRLMDETDREFREPEGNRRRSAIAHLRAAVAATRADRLLGKRKDEFFASFGAYLKALDDAIKELNRIAIPVKLHLSF